MVAAGATVLAVEALVLDCDPVALLFEQEARPSSAAQIMVVATLNVARDTPLDRSIVLIYTPPN